MTTQTVERVQSTQVRDKVLQLNFEQVRDVLTRRGWSEERVTNAIWEYATWLQKLQDEPMGTHDISQDAAYIWHGHILSISTYKVDMGKLFGYGYQVYHGAHKISVESKFYRSCPICAV